MLSYNAPTGSSYSKTSVCWYKKWPVQWKLSYIACTHDNNSSIKSIAGCLALLTAKHITILMHATPQIMSSISTLAASELLHINLQHQSATSICNTTLQTHGPRGVDVLQACLT